MHTHATAMKYIGRRESPIPRKMELMMLYAVINGIPRKQTRRYDTVPSTASAGVAITEVIGRISAHRMPARTMDRARNKVTVPPI